MWFKEHWAGGRWGGFMSRDRTFHESLNLSGPRFLLFFCVCFIFTHNMKIHFKVLF